MFYEGEDRIFLGGTATILDDTFSNMETATSAWASKYLVPNQANAYVLGRFVESDKANNNKQYFKLGDLMMSKPTISYAPLNINHSNRAVIGSFIASEMQYPVDEGLNPFIEALSAVWKFYFPDEWGTIQKAQSEGGVFYSMEAVPQSLSTIGGTDDAAIYPYEGRTSPNYPAEINERSVQGIVLNQPHFVGGALVIPPARPGWSRADVKQVAEFMREQWVDAERIYEGVAEELPQFDVKTWEWVMGQLILATLEESRDFSGDARKKLAKEGKAMKDGSFPIVSEQDLKNAIQAIGRAKNPAAAKAHIKSRAKALGLTKLIPEDW